MATMVLSAAASAATAGSATFAAGTIGSALLNAGVQAAGGAIDNALFGAGDVSRNREGARLDELGVQSSAYGTMIPIVYGNARIAGNIIWARPIVEIATTTSTSQGGGKSGGSGRVTSNSTEYSYYATLAIAICEGEVDTIERVWADAKLLDLSQGTYRFYTGSETQQPDALIESYEGVGSTPAYRGVSYVVIEDFPLADYGNRVPNFTFEIKKKALSTDVDDNAVENLVTSIMMIPGSGEFVYDTQEQTKVFGEEVVDFFTQRAITQRVNLHTPQGKANALVALDQLEETLPNVQWVGLVVNWFGDALDAGDCEIYPGVEFKSSGLYDDSRIEPNDWSVANQNRSAARLIGSDDGNIRYGGTPDDEGIVRFVDALKARGYNVFILPMPLMDVEGKPWRGEMTGSTSDVASFFTKSNGYNNFVLHYAHLLAGKIDAFAIGSELKGLTAVTDGAGGFPAVDALVSLAASVKTILGNSVTVTYAADWSEYHHTEGGWYHLDPLWASSNIDVVGIDAYFPLTNAPQNTLGYDIQTVRDGWTSGEDYDFYYTDSDRTITAPLAPAYAAKNIEWWWKNSHVNPNEATTAWVPESKPIWFTEFGFPSVDGATNQPNVFYDPDSVAGNLPRLSQGRVDFLAQRTGIAATLAEWKNSNMVQNQFLWTWDARPFPYWPDLEYVWSDGGLWRFGHWVQGKLGSSGLGALVKDLCLRSGLPESMIDVSRLQEQVDGYVLNRASSARGALEQLMAAYFFDAVERSGQLVFVPRGGEAALEIEVNKTLPAEGNPTQEAVQITRTQELELPKRVEVLYINRLPDYQQGTQHSTRQVTDAVDHASLSLPIVLSDQRAKTVADVILYNRWLERVRYRFDLPMEYAALEPTDVIRLRDAEVVHTVRLTSVQHGKPGRVRCAGVAEDVAAYDFYVNPAEREPLTQEVIGTVATKMELLDLPAFPSDGAEDAPLRVAATGLGANWPGAALFRSDDGGANYSRVGDLSNSAVIGVAGNALAAGPHNVFDEVSVLEVILQGANLALSSASRAAVLNGANALLVGEEVLQFTVAIELAAGRYRLSGLLRGRQGTEHAIEGHVAGERVVLLDNQLAELPIAENLMGLSRSYKGVSVGATLGAAAAQNFIFSGRAYRPYAPVHLGGVRDASGTLILSWVRRTRVGGQWRDFVDAPLSEASELYEVEILDGETVVRTLAVAIPTASYSAAEQISDFGSLQASLRVKIYQLSAKIGRGFAASGLL